jgi:valyl-tRNA synthetase
MVNSELSTRYDASAVEQHWYGRWEEAGLFQPKDDPNAPVYSITIPPPNITGSLHMGHALCYSIQDLLGRFYRMRGYSVLILPGQDHAGIATQSVVAKNLKAQGEDPVAMGRDAFVERVWDWRRESGDTILNQFRRLGCAFEWGRSRFTLDPDYAEAVLKVFIEWFDRGWIYLGERIVNWDPALQTSVSDIETERQELKGKLYHIRYPFADGSGHVVVATTRPETMLGDVAVAVHPGDERYKGLVGKELRLPLMDRLIPLIPDLYPDPTFGTGAVKITPAHDPNDFEVGVRHNLPMPVVLDTRGKVNENGGAYAGLDRYEARKRIVADLEANGLLEKVEDHQLAVNVSTRSGVVIEPLLREEWFASQTKLAKEAIRVVEEKQIRFVPERYEHIYLDWLENIRDWNISRNLWWGHRIPVYTTASGKQVAALSWEEAEKKAGEPIASQDERVLDTWFSSGLWPFATLGWPKDTEDLTRFYPTSVLVTSRDILYLWVARMVMMGMDFVKEIPFRDVYIYATVLTEDGKRMSKSLGTGVDPMTIIDTIGADALRFTLQSQTGYNQDIRYSDRRTEDARNFCNKIWNATRFVLMNVDSVPAAPQSLEPIDQWLLSRLAKTEVQVRQAYESYNIQEAASALYRFFWSELCDWYIEISKSRLLAGEAAPKWVLVSSLEAFFKMLHPIMPHITEELYQHLPLEHKDPYLMASSWPEIPADFSHPEAEAQMERAFEIVRALRSLRADLGLAPLKMAPSVYVQGDIAGIEGILQSQAWFETVVNSTPPSNEPALFATVEGVDLHLTLGEMSAEQRVAEVERLEKEIAKLDADIQKLKAKLSNDAFVSRAKPEVVEKDRELLAELVEKSEKLGSRARLFKGSA